MESESQISPFLPGSVMRNRRRSRGRRCSGARSRGCSAHSTGRVSRRGPRIIELTVDDVALRLDDAVAKHLIHRHLFDREGRRRARSEIEFDHIAKEVAFAPAVNDRVAERDDERLVANELLGKADGVAVAALLSLAGEEESHLAVVAPGELVEQFLVATIGGNVVRARGRRRRSPRSRIRPVTKRISRMPAAYISSTTYWTQGLRPTGSISFGCDLAAGRSRCQKRANEDDRFADAGAGSPAIADLHLIASLFLVPGPCPAKMRIAQAIKQRQQRSEQEAGETN